MAAYCPNCGHELNPNRALCPGCARAPGQTTVKGMPAGVPQTAGVSKTIPMEDYVKSGPAAGSAVTKSQAMTMVAGEGLGLARTFNTMLSQPFPGWRAELAEPPGPSSGGGKQVRQNISLITPSGGRLAMGHVDTVARTATLRSYDMINALHEQRFSQPLSITSDEYQKYVGITSHMLSGIGLVVSHEVRSLSVVPASAEPSGDSRGLFLVVVLGVAVLLALLIYSQL
jgi:hypothetical protein